MTHQWRILFRPIIANPSRVKILVQAICVLHNYLRTVNDITYTPPGFTDRSDDNGTVVEGFWRVQNRDSNRLLGTTHNSRNSANNAVVIRENFSHYFMSAAGSVSWQLDYINAR